MIQLDARTEKTSIDETIIKKSHEINPYLRVSRNEKVQVFHREDIPGIQEMNLEGEKTYLGEVRNFKNLCSLKKVLPKDLSISWTMMPSGRELPAHYHPCSSLILVTKGQGESTGDTISPLESGDIVHIPEWNLHGFKGKGSNGFSALSIQFQETAIFSSEDTPETTYIDREAIPLKERELKIIKRKELPELNQIQFEGGKKDLGIVKNFAESETIAEKLPAYFSAAWVHLNPGQKLDTHKHDTASLIIVTEGEGSLQGDLHRTLREGDTVHVPPGCWHGFTGAGDKGFWALSIQFQETSLYENRTKPQVQFSTPKINASMTKKTQSQSLEIFSFDQFLQRNEQLAEEFLRNPIFHIDREEIKQNPLKKQKLMDCLQVMSNSFQRLIFSRMSLCDDSDFKSVFLEHLLDEIGHDTDLEKERGKKELLWDPILHASTSWFNAKNFVVDNPARVVMVQMVLERGAFYFYSHYNRLLSQEGLESEHIKNHSIADEGHDKLGVELLEDESPKKLKSYQKLLEESWNMLELFLGRTAELVQTVK